MPYVHSGHRIHRYTRQHHNTVNMYGKLSTVDKSAKIKFSSSERMEKVKWNWWKGKPSGSIPCMENSSLGILTLCISGNKKTISNTNALFTLQEVILYFISKSWIRIFTSLQSCIIGTYTLLDAFHTSIRRKTGCFCMWNTSENRVLFKCCFMIRVLSQYVWGKLLSILVYSNQ